jgi:caspase Dronc
VLGILTHGSHSEGVTRILFGDMSLMKLDDVMERFQNRNCIHLLGKPKIFLFPFCRGEISDHGSYVTSTPQPLPRRRTEHDAVRDVAVEEKWPTYSDILICYATVVGFMTHRDVQDGSWYIQNMVNLWAEHAHDTHVEDLVKMVGLGECIVK